MERFKALTAGVGLCTALAMPGTSHANSIIFTNFGLGYAYNTAVGNIVGNDFIGDNLARRRVHAHVGRDADCVVSCAQLF